jgi:hypothetical protein
MLGFCPSYPVTLMKARARTIHCGLTRILTCHLGSELREYIGQNHRSFGLGVNWKTICQPKSQSGLGVMNTSSMNIALMPKWIWRIYREEKICFG